MGDMDLRSEQTHRNKNTSVSLTSKPPRTPIRHTSTNYLSMTIGSGTMEESGRVVDSSLAARDSRLRHLDVYLNERSVLRVKSRISSAENITADQRAPAVLDGDHLTYTKLYTAWLHRLLLHVGTETVVNEIGQYFWVLKLRSTTRSIVKSCLECRIRKTRPPEPPTGDHPRC
ncbi:hypothetical protein EVAR_49556_1 [Eumeta japonica]|uniref:Integrase zinc-binding domain-containing protein n=1 Tax=Eumeta variegata TaxID=151549 RepID=A0A4C1XHS5_EUMVA|nr:hypothetical protein EVAR_49556_1 [Eumeta japonica]